MFERAKFHHLERQYGPSTLDAAASKAGENSQCKDYCSSENSFLVEKLKGHSIWANPPYDQAEAFLEHYLRQKEQYPENSAMFVLPQWESQPWWHLTKRFKRVRHYGKGSQLFSSPGPSGIRLRRGVTAWPVNVYWDEPASVASPATAPSEGDDRLDSSDLPPLKESTIAPLSQRTSAATRRRTSKNSLTISPTAGSYLS